MRWTLPLLLTIAAVALAWHAGELHRHDCTASGRTGCGVLPWQNGTAPALDLRGMSEIQRERVQRALARR